MVSWVRSVDLLSELELKWARQSNCCCRFHRHLLLSARHHGLDRRGLRCRLLFLLCRRVGWRWRMIVDVVAAFDCCWSRRGLGGRRAELLLFLPLLLFRLRLLVVIFNS